MPKFKPYAKTEAPVKKADAAKAKVKAKLKSKKK